MGTRLLFSHPTVGDNILLTEDQLSLDNLLTSVSGPDRGGIVVFSGVVRDTEDGKPIGSITYEAYVPMAKKEIEKILREAQDKWDIRAAVHHRLGVIPVGESSLLVACAGIHRREAFEAGQWIVDAVKGDVPVWKVKFQWV